MKAAVTSMSVCRLCVETLISYLGIVSLHIDLKTVLHYSSIKGLPLGSCQFCVSFTHLTLTSVTQQILKVLSVRLWLTFIYRKEQTRTRTLWVKTYPTFASLQTKRTRELLHWDTPPPLYTPLQPSFKPKAVKTDQHPGVTSGTSPKYPQTSRFVVEHFIAILPSSHCVNAPRVGAENSGGFGDYWDHTMAFERISRDKIWKLTVHQPTYPPRYSNLELLTQMRLPVTRRVYA